MVMDYQLIMVPATELAKNVIVALEDGWELHGAPFFVKEERESTLDVDGNTVIIPWVAQAVTHKIDLGGAGTQKFPPNFTRCQRHHQRPRRSTSCHLCNSEKARGEETAQEEQDSAEE